LYTCREKRFVTHWLCDILQLYHSMSLTWTWHEDDDLFVPCLIHWSYWNSYSTPVVEQNVVMSISVCEPICLKVSLHHIPWTTRLNFVKFSLHVTYGCGSILLWWRYNMLRTSGFVYDIIFSSHEPTGKIYCSIAALLVQHRARADAPAAWYWFCPVADGGRYPLDKSFMQSVPMHHCLQVLLTIHLSAITDPESRMKICKKHTVGDESWPC